MTCREAEDLFLAHSLGEATPESFRAHIAHCATCRRRYAEFVEAGALLRSLPDVTVRPGFAESVLAEIRRYDARTSSAWWRLRGLVLHPAFGVALAGAAVVLVIVLGGLDRGRATRTGPEPGPILEAPSPSVELPEPETATPETTEPHLAGAEERSTEPAVEAAPQSSMATAATHRSSARRAADRARSTPLVERSRAPEAKGVTEPESRAFASDMARGPEESALPRPTAGEAVGGLAGSGAGGGYSGARGSGSDMARGGFGGAMMRGHYERAPGQKGDQAGESEGVGTPMGPAGPKGDPGPAGLGGSPSDARARPQRPETRDQLAAELSIEDARDFVFRDATVGEAIDRIAAVGKLVVDVRASLVGRPKLTVRLRNVTPPEALKRVCRTAGLEVEEAGGKRYVVVERGEQP